MNTQREETSRGEKNQRQGTLTTTPSSLPSGYCQGLAQARVGCATRLCDEAHCGQSQLAKEQGMWPSGELKGLDHSSTGCPENAQSLANGNPQRANELGEGMAPFLWFKTVGPQPCGLRPRGRSETWEVSEPGCQGNSPTVINGLCSLASPSWFFHLHRGGWGESSRKFFLTSRPVSCTENANGAASGRPATRAGVWQEKVFGRAAQTSLLP